jgi:hypothetical protein
MWIKEIKLFICDVIYGQQLNFTFIFLHFQQGNVIVLDLSQEHQMASNNTSTTLSDLLQASGIMTSDNEGNSDSGSGTSSVGSAACRVGGGQHDNLMEGLNHRQPQQVLLQQRIPAEKCKTQIDPCSS